MDSPDTALPDAELVRAADRAALALVTARHAAEPSLVGGVLSSLAGSWDGPSDLDSDAARLVRLVLHVLTVRAAHAVQDAGVKDVLEEASLFASLACEGDASEHAAGNAVRLVAGHLVGGSADTTSHLPVLLSTLDRTSLAEHLSALAELTHAVLVVAACRVGSNLPNHLRRWGLSVAE